MSVPESKILIECFWASWSKSIELFYRTILSGEINLQRVKTLSLLASQCHRTNPAFLALHPDVLRPPHSGPAACLLCPFPQPLWLCCLEPCAAWSLTWQMSYSGLECTFLLFCLNAIPIPVQASHPSKTFPYHLSLLSYLNSDTCLSILFISQISCA